MQQKTDSTVGNTGDPLQISRRAKPQINLVHKVKITSDLTTPSKTSSLLKQFVIQKFKLQYFSKKFIYLFKKRWPHLEKFHFFSFSAVKLKKPDKIDYLISFSAELVLITFIIGSVVLNSFYFSWTTYPSDTSLASEVLKEHHSPDDKLYTKIAAVRTIVDNGNSLFVPEAHAESPMFMQETEAQTETDIFDDSTSGFTISDDNTIIKPNPDSVGTLINKQIKVHTVTEGETLAGIAKSAELDTNTIKWANNLTSDLVKPGWELLIPPVKGVVIKAGKETTLPQIAFKYKCDLNRIISFNGLDGADDIKEGDVIIGPDCSIAPPPPAVATKKPGSKTTSKTTTSILSQLGNHIFPKGYCTYYVASKMKINFGGNANRWVENAQAAGYVTTKTPHVGAAVETSDGPRKYGHVAYVEKVTDSYIEVSEMNFKGFNKISTRKIPINSSTIKGYILPK